jgi:hypothetical protein
MDTHLIFGVNIGNIGRARNSRPIVREQVAAVNRALYNAEIPAQLTSSFGHTGNFVLQMTNCSLASTRLIIETALLTKVVIVPLIELESYVAKLSAIRELLATPGTRPTPGLVLYVDGPAQSGSIESTARVKFQRLSQSVVAAWKLDILTDRNILDRSQRQGGWGALSYEVAHQVGGLWTARSLRTIMGLITRAKQNNGA